MSLRCIDLNSKHKSNSLAVVTPPLTYDLLSDIVLLVRFVDSVNLLCDSEYGVLLVEDWSSLIGNVLSELFSSV